MQHIHLTVQSANGHDSFDVEFTDYIDTNDQRAQMVEPFLAAYKTAYYGPDAESDATVLTDLLANLMHLADRIPERDDEPELLGADSAIDRARFHHQIEINEREEA